MEQLAHNLKNELEKKLEHIHYISDDPLIYSEPAITVTLECMQHLKNSCIKHKFKNTSEEIHFFKEIKPSFVSKLIYYNEIYSIETNCPFGSTKSHRKYYSEELAKLKIFTDNNAEFYRYYKKGNSFLDHMYFVRGKYDVKLNMDSQYLLADHRFSTSHDYKVAQIQANTMIKCHLQNQINHHGGQPVPFNNQNPQVPFKWTGSKVGIIELIYALHTEGVFNNGGADLQTTIRFFEKAFDIDLGQFHRTFFEISARKNNRTKFLQVLQEKLTRRMDDRDQM